MVGHVAPEVAEGGPIALVRDGDPVLVGVDARRLELEVPTAELEDRQAASAGPGAGPARSDGPLPGVGRLGLPGSPDERRRPLGWMRHPAEGNAEPHDPGPAFA